MEHDMSEGLKNFLNKFDGKYKAATTASKEMADSSSYEDISDGKYLAVITGVGWRDYQNADQNKWSGMGPTLRLRIVGGRNGEPSRFSGWKEDVTYFLFNVHPERGINTPELNEKKLSFFLGQMDRVKANPPSSIGDLVDWKGAVGLQVLVSIVTKKDGDRTYRNVYFDGRAVHAVEGGTFPLEEFSDQRWIMSEQPVPSSKNDQPSAPAKWPSDDEIPF